MNRTINISGLKINVLGYKELLGKIESALRTGEKCSITYANSNTINLLYADSRLREIYDRFDIVHADGIGIFLASRFLFGKEGFKERVTGSDLYPVLIGSAIEKQWRLFLFGHDMHTLNKAKEHNPELNITGVNEGYGFNDDEVVKMINDSGSQILVIGLGSPGQEKWIQLNSPSIRTAVIIAVGDGIKVFAGTKFRGPVLFRKLGLEWFFRLLSNPFKYFKRYFIGIPVFLCRMFILKIRNLSSEKG